MCHLLISVGDLFLAYLPFSLYLSTYNLLLFLVYLFSTPVNQFWYVVGGSVIHPLPFPLVPQIPWPKCLGKEKIPSVQQDRDGQLVPV